ncbi:MAG: (Fe-S)-binding protein [Candidatus Hermodarchaeota archaeon]
MESKNQIVDKLKQILKESQVLTDLEDIYVYSFEKVYLNQNCPKPDIVVKVHSLKEENEVMGLAEKENAVVIKRGEKYSSSIHKPAHPLILLDNLKIPKLENCYEKLTESEKLITNLRKLHINEYGTYQNLVLAIQNLLFSGTLNKCQQCVTCSGYCTIAPSFKGVETWSSKGRMLIGRGIMNGELTLSKKIVDVLYSCTKCGLCFVQCFQDLEFHDAILHLRHKLAEKKLVPEVFHTAAKNIFEYGDPSAIPVNRRLSWIRNVPKLSLRETADNLCWLGCTVSTRTPKTAKAFINILNHANIDFTMLREKEGCCGYVLISSGLLDEAKKVAIEVIERIKRTRSKILITPCSGCYYTFTRLYPEILNVEMPCEILHTSQYIEKLLKEEKIKLKPLKLDVTYHDPCSLGRHSNVYDAPRSVLKAIPYLNLIEMPLNRNCARCCGGGGGLWTFNNQVSLETTQMRLKEDFLPTNIKILTTACPQCQLNFRFASRISSIPKNLIEIYDITELIELALDH